MVRQRVRRDVVGLHKRGIQQITQRDAVARLKANIIFGDSNKHFCRDRDWLIEIARFLLRPIEHYARGRDFCQATDLQLFPTLLLFQNVARLRVGNEICLRGSSRAEKAHTGEKGGKNDEKSMW